MKPVEPILVIELFPPERAHLLELLASLSPEEWEEPTVCPGWSVKDVALHVLGDDVGLLSRTAEFRFPGTGGFDSWDELVAFINRANQLWVEATRRMSPELLLKFLAFTGEESYRRLKSLDLFALGEPVSWAGPEPAPIWLDVAREYTERWMHQQHIRDAVGQPGLKDRSLFGPVLETFVRALPHTFREVERRPGTIFKLTISGEAGGEWLLARDESVWSLYQEADLAPDAQLTMDQETAWRLFTKGITPEAAQANSLLAGDRSLGVKMLETVSIIA